MASRLEELNLGFADALDTQRNRLVARIRNYLLPRITSPDGPLTIVFAGPTGSGKSTLVNTLSGLEISRTGPIRPTTKAPVVLTSTNNARAFQRLGAVNCEVLTGSAPVLDELAMVDTPDIDSTATEHRVVAEQLIDTADVVVFVTSALRYADLVPWQVLRRAHSRGAPVLFVLNRTTTDATGAVIDFERRLAEAGFVPNVVKVPEHHLAPGSQAIPALAVLGLRRRLLAFAGRRRQGRAEITERVLAATMVEVNELMDAVDDGLAEMDLTAERIRTPFTGRARSTLDLAGLALELTLTPVPTWGPWRRSRWLRRNRRKPDEAAAWRGLAVAAIKARVESELIKLVVEVDPRLTPVAPAAYRTVLDTAVDAWMDRALGLVGDTREKDRPLASMVLISATLGDTGGELVRDLAGLDGGSIDTMRAELKDRLDVVYGFVGDLAAASQTTNA